MIASQLDMNRPLIMLIPDILTGAECTEWISRIRSAVPDLAPINTARGVMLDSQIRNNRRVMLDDQQEATRLLERVKGKVPEQIHGMRLSGINERLRCYEYQIGQHFAPHSDGAFVRNEREQSWYTFMVYLNEDFEGGETVFFVEPEKSIRPQTGLGLLFQHPIIHEGAEVTKGTKYVIRTDLMYRQDAT